MINVIKSCSRWLSIGILAATGCTSAVKEEDFLEYKRSSENIVKTLKKEIDAAHERTVEANARYEALLKSIEEVSARLSVSSMGNYAVGLDEQVTQHAQQYLQLAGIIADLQKKVWELGDTNTQETTKLHFDLTKSIEDAKKAYETFKNEDYKAFKEQNLQETSASQKKLEALETGLKNLELNVQQLVEANTLQPGEEIYKASASVRFADTATHSLAQEYIRAHIEYMKATGESAPEDKAAQVLHFTRIAGDNSIVDIGELDDRIKNLASKVTELRKKTGQKYETLDMKRINFTGEDVDTASVAVRLQKEQANRIKDLVAKYKPSDASMVWALKSYSIEGKLTQEGADRIEEYLKAGGK